MPCPHPSDTLEKGRPSERAARPMQGRRGMSAQSTIETIAVEGAQLAEVVKNVIHEGNVRRLIIKQHDETIVELPLTVGVVGAALAPALAVAGALAALLTNCTIEVERVAPHDGTA